MPGRIRLECVADFTGIGTGAFNCVFSDGKYLFCYRDLVKARDLFHLTIKNDVKNKRTAEIFAHENLHIFAGENVKGVVVATRPMDDGAWMPFLGGQLLVLREGEIIANFKHQ